MAEHQSAVGCRGGDEMTRHVRWVHDVLVSLCCARLVIAHQCLQDGSYLIGWLGRPLEWWDRILNPPDFHRSPYHYLPMAWCVLALIVFVSLRLLQKTALVKATVCRVAGLVAVAGIPQFYAIFTDPGGRTLLPEQPSVITAWQIQLEALAAAACVVLYVFGRRWMKPAVGITLVLLHFGLWFWLLPGSHWIVLLFACTSVVWGLRVRLPDGGGRLSEPSTARPGQPVA